MTTQATQPPFLTRGQRDALVDALQSAGDTGFVETAIILGLPNPDAMWHIFARNKWLIRCLDCGHWLPPAGLTKAGDICTACLIRGKTQ